MSRPARSGPFMRRSSGALARVGAPRKVDAKPRNACSPALGCRLVDVVYRHPEDQRLIYVRIGFRAAQGLFLLMRGVTSRLDMSQQGCIGAAVKAADRFSYLRRKGFVIDSHRELVDDNETGNVTWHARYRLRGSVVSITGVGARANTATTTTGELK